MPAGDSDTARHILETARTIAVVGASPRPERPSHDVMAYLQRHGYRCLPVNPGQAGRDLLGETVSARLPDLPQAPDLVLVFRRAEETPPIAREAAESGATALWLQQGIVNEEAAAIARAAGLAVVMDRCAKVDHSRFFA